MLFFFHHALNVNILFSTDTTSSQNYIEIDVENNEKLLSILASRDWFGKNYSARKSIVMKMYTQSKCTTRKKTLFCFHFVIFAICWLNYSIAMSTNCNINRNGNVVHRMGINMYYFLCVVFVACTRILLCCVFVFFSFCSFGGIWLCWCAHWHIRVATLVCTYTIHTYTFMHSMNWFLLWIYTIMMWISHDNAHRQRPHERHVIWIKQGHR